MTDLSVNQREWSHYFSDDSNFVKAWMFLPEDLAEKCLSGEVTRPSFELAMEQGDYSAAYHWMKSAMLRAGIQPSAGTIFNQSPWWCWIQAENGRNVPSACNGNNGHALLELRIPTASLLISEFSAWHAVINNWFLSKTEADEEQFEAELKAAGVTLQAGQVVPKVFQERICHSWDAIFDMNGLGEYWSGPMPEKMLQAVFWELTPEMIVGRVSPAPNPE